MHRRLGYAHRMRFWGKIGLGLAVLLVGSWAVARPVITAVQMRVDTQAQVETIVLQSRSKLQVVKQFGLSNPDRIVVDVQSAEGKSVALPGDYKGNLIKTLRFGQFNPKLSRLVIETAQAVRVQSTKQLPAGGLSITLVAANVLAKTMETEKTEPKENPAPLPTRGRDGTVKQNLVPRADAGPTPQATPITGKGPAAPRAPPVASSDDEAKDDTPPDVVTPTNAKGKLPLIVLDAGHGGQDPGASGVHDIHEKYITLAMVKQLRDGLLATGRYRVALTRADDRYILLPERVDIARRLKADLFISIHADSNPMLTARGLSIYSVSEVASDKTSAALAERENKSDIIGGLDLNTADKDVANILIDLTQHETGTKSLELADALVASMDNRVTMLPGSPHRFAGFRVLKAPDIPSVLIELGFLTNPRDEAQIQSPEYRQIIVQSVIKGVDRFMGRKRK